MSAASGQKIHLILDFDGTIVKDNTLPLLDYLVQDGTTVTYKSFLDPYMIDYNDHVKAYRPAKRDRLTLQQEYDYLDSLREIERSSIQRIERSGWLKDVRWDVQSMSVFNDAARRIQSEKPLAWRPGLTELVEAVWKENGVVDILSVNWSSNFIRSLIQNQHGDQIDVSRIRIHSNEIDPSGTGRLSRVSSMEGERSHLIWPEQGTVEYTTFSGIWTGKDKADTMQTITTKSKADGALVIYIGDSKTDLKCMMEADLGIRMVDVDDLSEEQIGLSEVLHRLNCKEQRLEEYHNDSGDTSAANEIVWCVTDFLTVHKVLFTGRTDFP